MARNGCVIGLMHSDKNDHRIAAIIALVLIVSAPVLAADDGGQHKAHLNHVAILLGTASEKQKDGHRESGGMIGIAYERRVAEKWSFAAAYEEEAFGDKTQRHSIVFVGARYELNDRWSVFGGPGVEFRKLGEREHALLRVGAAYGFDLGRGFSLSPELSIDIVAGGTRVYVFALALGYGF